MTMITPSYLGETIEYSSLHACRSTLEDPTFETVCSAIVYSVRIGPLQPNPLLSQSDPQTLQPSDFVILAVNAGFAAAAEAWGELDCWMLVFRRKFPL